MTDTTPDSLPQIVIDEAWSEFLYPRAAVDDLSHPAPTSGFIRAVRVFQRGTRDAVAAELERIAKGRSMIAPEELRDRAAELRGGGQR